MATGTNKGLLLIIQGRLKNKTLRLVLSTIKGKAFIVMLCGFNFLLDVFHKQPHFQ